MRIEASPAEAVVAIFSQAREIEMVTRLVRLDIHGGNYKAAYDTMSELCDRVDALFGNLEEYLNTTGCPPLTSAESAAPLS